MPVSLRMPALIAFNAIALSRTPLHMAEILSISTRYCANRNHFVQNLALNITGLADNYDEVRQSGHTGERTWDHRPER